MDGNKDEAFRAKKIAETKFTERDYSGAKKFALKALSLYPELEGISEMLTTFEVHISSERRVSSGEVDWYGVLGVASWADDETVKKQYRKLALLLHPDRNKSLGADGAFKLVSEAWSLLSDKAKRSAYNQKLSVVETPLKNPPPTTAPPRPGTNGIKRSISSGASTHQKHKSRLFTSAPSPSQQKPDTFWTICKGCKTHYEYLRVYLNQTLLCPNCNQAFVAVERSPPPNLRKSSGYSSQEKHQDSRRHLVASNGLDKVSGGFAVRNGDVQGNRSYWTGGIEVKVAQPPDRAQTTNAAQSHEKSKRKHQLQIDQMFKMRRSEGTFRSISRGSGLGSASEPQNGSFQTGEKHGFASVNTKHNVQIDLSLVDIRSKLIEKIQKDILAKLQEWRSNEPKMKGNRKWKSTIKADVCDHKVDDFTGIDKADQNRKNFPFSSSNGLEAPAPTSINVPDPDFYNFDLDRSENAFSDDQVWAAYDETDGMPRYYARIHQVISLSPFKIKISWLNSKSNSEFGALDWVGCGFTKICGDFRAGRHHEISETLNSFSHKVNWTKGTRGIIRILPRKGDIWAVYKNWSPDWNEHTPDDVVHKYDMVQVLKDYDDEGGTSVILLLKVPGFKAVFQKDTDQSRVRRIPKEEMFRFSHQVPCHLLTGKEAENTPIGCLELDPAATPLELLQVITEPGEAQTTAARDNDVKEGM